MKSYEEITNQVLETAQVRTVKIKRIRYAATTAVVCVCCAIGGAAFMKLEKPEIKPSDLYTEESHDTLHSASDPSAEETTEMTEAPTTETTPVQTTLPETTAVTTLATTMTMMTETEEAIVPTEIVPIYVESGAPIIMTSIPGETHSAQTTKHTATTAKPVETTVSTEETEAETTATDPIETEMTTAESTKEVVETKVTEETAAVETSEVIEGETEDISAETDVPSEEPQKETLPPIPLDKWRFLLELYFNGELPFDLESLPEDATEEEIISLFPELFLEETE